MGNNNSTPTEKPVAAQEPEAKSAVAVHKAIAFNVVEQEESGPSTPTQVRYR